MNVLFVLDEYTDVAPPHVVREMVDIVIDALYNPDKPRPEGEIVLGELTRQSVYFCNSVSQNPVLPLCLTVDSGLAVVQRQHPRPQNILRKHLPNGFIRLSLRPKIATMSPCIPWSHTSISAV